MTHHQPAMSPGLSARVTKAMTLSDSAFHTKTKDNESEAEGAGSGSVESEDEGPGSEGEEAAPDGKQQQAASVEVTPIYRPLVPDQQLADGTPTPRVPVHTTWIDPEDVVPTPVASLVTTPTATIAVDKDEFLEVGAQLELHESILHDHTQCLDALPPTLFEGYDRDLRELYTRSRAVSDEIFVIGLGVWRHVDAQRAEMWQARYDDHRLIHDVLVQHTAMQRELQEMRDRVATLEEERSLIMEYLVNISKRRAFWSLNEDILKINDFDYQYAVSIKEDTAYPCLHSPKTTKETSSIRRIQRRPIRRIEDIGAYGCILGTLFRSVQEVLIRASRLKKVMADKGKKSSMETFAPNDKADYYSRITSITVNEKNAYELKGKFLDDLHNNAFSGTNEKDAVEHIEYYLKIIDPIKLPNVDHDKLRIVVFPISLAGGA
ncbi:hypothetical protein Tco_0413526 [Tanacetum coccineum]